MVLGCEAVKFAARENTSWLFGAIEQPSEDPESITTGLKQTTYLTWHQPTIGLGIRGFGVGGDVETIFLCIEVH